MSKIMIRLVLTVLTPQVHDDESIDPINCPSFHSGPVNYTYIKSTAVSSSSQTLKAAGFQLVDEPRSMNLFALSDKFGYCRAVTDEVS